MEICFEMMHDYPPSLAAAKKLGKVPENFAFTDFEWLMAGKEISDIMRVTGAEYRAANTGPYRGLRTVKVRGTERVVYVTRKEIIAAEKVLPKKKCA